MAQDNEAPVVAESPQQSQLILAEDDTKAPRNWMPWFVGGLFASFLGLCSLVLLSLLVFSIVFNFYLAWQMSGIELVLRVPVNNEAQAALQPAPDVPVAVVRFTPEPPPTATPLPTNTPIPTATPLPTETPIPTATATPPPTNTPVPSPTPTLTQIDTDLSGSSSSSGSPSSSSSSASGVSATTNSETSASTNQESDEATASIAAHSFTAITSEGSYKLIPIEGGRDDRIPAEHGDLNIKLRDPQPAQVDLTLIDYTGAQDSNAPQFSAIFGRDPEIVGVYTVHDWDWGCNCKGKLKSDGYLIGLKTTPGEPVYIPHRKSDIYGGEYYAIVLYAAEDTVTIAYVNRGNVSQGYTVHYLGLQTDPNLLKMYQQSTNKELVGLTLDTPVGYATDELIMGIRDNGTFMDTRSRKDWWD